MMHYYKYKDDLPDWEKTTVMGALVNCPHCKDLMAQDELQEHERKEDSMLDKTFYLVLIDAAELPRKRYDSLDEAMHAAERMLALPGNQNKGVHILQSVAYGNRNAPCPCCGQARPVDWLVGKLD